jgi:hypothetical protein
MATTTRADLVFRYDETADSYDQADAELWCKKCERRIWHLVGDDVLSHIDSAVEDHLSGCPGKPLPTSISAWIYNVETDTEMEFVQGFLTPQGWALFNLGGDVEWVKPDSIISWTEGD